MTSLAASDIDTGRILFRQPGDRLHYVHQYTGEMYKIVQFYREIHRYGPGPREQQQHYDKKLDASFCRAKKTVLELALCNDWQYFVTLTIDQTKADRFDLDAWHKKFREFLKYQRKAHGLQCDYLLVPERHLDGSWHAHGLIRGNMKLISFREMDAQGYRSANGHRLKKKLRVSDYLNWPAYQKSFGFCSFGPIRSHYGSGFYVSKYITKDLARCVDQVGKHLYFSSQGLNRSHKFGEFFNRSDALDALLTSKYDFCASGFVQPNLGWDTHIAGCIIEAMGGHVGALRPFSFSSPSDRPSPDELEADTYSVFEQMAMLEIY